MQKNLTQFRLNAVALALLATSNAWALTPADGAPDLVLYIPGSQANDPAFGFPVNSATVANAVCENNWSASATNTDSPTTTHIYFEGGVNDNYSAVYCYTNNTLIPGLTTGTGSNNHTKLLISRRRLGASGVGLDAVAHGTKLTYISPSDLSSCTFGNGSYSSGGATYQYNYNCSTVTSGISATAATSDVTPDVFSAIDNIATSTTAINAGQIANYVALGGHIIGTPVTLQLRNALQYAEIVTGMLPTSCLTTVTVSGGSTSTSTNSVGNETAACVPSLSREQLVSIFSGQITDWTQFQVTSSETLADVVSAGISAGVGGLTTPRDTVVHVCRREPGAGQQVAMLADILQYPCLGGNAPRLVNNHAGSDVVYATSLGAVDKCLGDYNDGTNNYFGTSNTTVSQQPPATSVPHGNQWAISIQTTERNATNSAHYRFIAHDGYLPIGEEAALNHYRLVGDYALAWNTTDPNTVRALNAIAAYSALPSTIAARNGTLSNQSFGQAGYVALVDNGYAPSPVWTPSNPVTPYSKLDGNGNPNACVIPYANQGGATWNTSVQLAP
ncbi:MAG: hypothetical protein PHW13_10380 [Methylococcales bacterium]|nr:hypothetical protein [Methylococcales bacterium]